MNFKELEFDRELSKYSKVLVNTFYDLQKKAQTVHVKRLVTRSLSFFP